MRYPIHEGTKTHRRRTSYLKKLELLRINCPIRTANFLNVNPLITKWTANLVDFGTWRTIEIAGREI